MFTLTKEKRVRTCTIADNAALDEMAVTAKEIKTLREKLGERAKENWGQEHICQRLQAIHLRDLLHLKRVLHVIPLEK